MVEPVELLAFTLPTTVKQVVEADRAFFRRRSDRDFRIRLLSAVERDMVADYGFALSDLPEGWRWFCALRRVGFDGFFLVPLAAPAGCETDVPEALAASLYGFADNLGPLGLLSMRAWGRSAEAHS